MSLQPRILIVDDEPLIHRVLRAALEAAGYEPLRAETGAEGLREMARAAPAAVVLDLGRPDMDGKAVLTKAREFYQEPILVLSARDKRPRRSRRSTSAPMITSRSRSGWASCSPGCGPRCASARMRPGLRRRWCGRARW